MVPVCGVGCGCQVSTLDVGGVGSWVLLLWPAMLGAAHSSKQLMGARSSRAVAQLQVLHCMLIIVIDCDFFAKRREPKSPSLEGSLRPDR